jgi:SAM-dependent methyltransferase
MSALANVVGPQYLLAQTAGVGARLRFPAYVWEPATARLLDAAGVAHGAHCLDLGCGAPGALGSLARRAGAHGRVVGIDIDPALVAEATRWARAERFDNVEAVCGDAFATGLPAASFDVVHVRFMFAPLGRADALLDEVGRLLRPGGIVVVQEPDAAAWRCWPRSPAFATLVDAIVDAFAAGGGDFNAGRRIFERLDARGYRDIGVRGQVVTLRGGHPYARLPLQFARSLAARLSLALGDERLDALKAECERVSRDPASLITSFVVQQAWGRKAGG